VALFTPVSIAEKLMFTVKRVETDVSVGTGYDCYVPTGEDGHVPVIVTNKHVMAGANRMRVKFHGGVMDVNGIVQADGTSFFLELVPGNSVLVEHPDVDLVGVTYGPALEKWSEENPGRQICRFPIRPNEIASDEDLSDLDASEAVTMVGCPNGLWDEINGFPLFRRGITASHPRFEFQGRSEFCVDIAVYSGSSGSPVFLLDRGLISSKKGGTSIGEVSRFALLGTLWGGPRINESGQIVPLPAPTDIRLGVETGVRMHLGYVIKGRETLRLFDLIRSRVEATITATPHSVEC
jgi:hypothetical protein